MSTHSFEPRAKHLAETNLATFIAYAREEVTAFGADLHFDAVCWNITAQRIAIGDRRARQGEINLYFTKKHKDGGHPLSDQVGAFAKAYVRSELANLSAAVLLRAIDAFRVLDQAMQEFGLDSVCDWDGTTFDQAVAILLSHDGLATVDAVGPRLGQIARFMDDRGLCRYPVGNWKYVKQRACSNGRIGEEFESRKLAKLPDIEALDALAQAFHLAEHPRDILVTAVAALLCSAPERINEVMVLRERCEVEQIGEDGESYLGLRWAGSKGYSDHVKWILPGMADVVRDALRKIREVTASSRRMAQWYETHPDKLYLPEAFEYLRGQEYLDFEAVADLLGMANNRSARSSVKKWLKNKGTATQSVKRSGMRQRQVVSFTAFERLIVAMLPAGFPVADAKTGLKFSESMLIVPCGLFGNSGASQCMFEPLRYHHVACNLGGNGPGGSVTVFRRVGLDYERRLAIRSHQFRHWLNTLAQGAGLSQLDIARWSGRLYIQQNVAYDHESSEDIVARIRAAVGDSAKAIGQLAELPRNLPVSRAEYAAMAVPTAHVTLYGFCIHDFTTTPCEMFRQCLDCREHVCIKGMPNKVERIRQALSEAQEHLVRATEAVASGIYGAEDWVVVHQATVDRLTQLLSLLTHPEINDGAVIQLAGSSKYSISEGAIRDHLTRIKDTVILNVEQTSSEISRLNDLRAKP